VQSPPIQYPREGFTGDHGKHQEQPHYCSDCATCKKVQDDLAILQGLVFKVRQEVEDLHFQLEVFDGKRTQIL
jgi:hypothetical protein